MIRSEIGLCIDLLKLPKVHSLPVDHRTSIVNSGGLKLFDVDTELYSLNIDYMKIQGYNNIAKKYDEKIDWEKIGDSVAFKAFDDNDYPLSMDEIKQLLDDKKWLLINLEETKKAKWLNPKLGLGQFWKMKARGFFNYFANMRFFSI